MVDYTNKRDDYERYGIVEYWRFDPSGGDYHDTALAGDLLVEGRYRPIEIERMGDGVRRGYSGVLGLYVCWEEGLLRFYNPETEDYLRSHQEAEARAEAETLRAEREAAARRAETIRAERAEAEARRLRERLERR